MPAERVWRRSRRAVASAAASCSASSARSTQTSVAPTTSTAPARAARNAPGVSAKSGPPRAVTGSRATRAGARVTAPPTVVTRSASPAYGCPASACHTETATTATMPVTRPTGSHARFNPRARLSVTPVEYSLPATTISQIAIANRARAKPDPNGMRIAGMIPASASPICERSSRCISNWRRVTGAGKRMSVSASEKSSRPLSNGSSHAPAAITRIHRPTSALPAGCSDVRKPSGTPRRGPLNRRKNAK